MGKILATSQPCQFFCFCHSYNSMEFCAEICVVLSEPNSPDILLGNRLLNQYQYIYTYLLRAIFSRYHNLGTIIPEQRDQTPEHNAVYWSTHIPYIRSIQIQICWTIKAQLHYIHHFLSDRYSILGWMEMKPLDCTHNPASPAKTQRTTMNMRNLLFLVKETMLYSLIYSLKHSQQVIIIYFSHPLNVAVECIL